MNVDVLHVNVIDAVRKCPDELNRIDSLPNQMAGIKVETELRAIVQCLERHLSRIDIKCNFSRMHF